jgi:RNA polymerase sigma factor (sigma-70 family)
MVQAAGPWIVKVCLDHLRARRNAPVATEGDEETHIPDTEHDFHRDLERRQMSACIREKIDLLPENLRAVILLNDVLELSQPEIAEILGIEVGNMKVRLHRARQRLRSILEAECAFGKDEQSILVCEPKPEKE